MKQYRIKIPEEGLTKVQLEILADRTKSLVWLVENQGRVLGDPDHGWPDFVLEEIKDEPEYDYKAGLLSILAITHRDGGHYTMNYGIEKSVKDACSKISELTHSGIKDEPMSADEAWKEYKLPEATVDRRLHKIYIDGFNVGAAENEKKHRLQQTFEEWWEEIGGMPYRNEQFARETWQAHAKATNTEA